MDTQYYCQNSHQRAEPPGVLLPLPQLGRWGSPSFLLTSRIPGWSCSLEIRKPLHSNCSGLHKLKGCLLSICCSKSQDIPNCDYQQLQPSKWKDAPFLTSAFQLPQSASNGHNPVHIHRLWYNGLIGGSPRDMSTQNLRMLHYLEKVFL